MSSDKTYLGDSVYADLQDSTIVLTTENGYPDDPSNIIYLEPEVMTALQIFINKVFSKGEEKKNDPHL